MLGITRGFTRAHLIRATLESIAYQTYDIVRAMERDYCKQVPIIAMTANAFAEDVHAAKTVGMNEHIAKPLDLNTLARILNKWLQR